MLWQLDGISQAPVEITVPYTHGPVPTGTIVHRSRRAPQPTTRFGIPTTVIERTLLDVCGILSSLIATKAIESALRQRLTTVERLHDFLKTAGGRGVKGTRRCRNILNQRMYDVATDSGAETEALYFIRRYDVPEPVLQHKVKTSMGTIRPDFYWPDIQKAVEIDGLDAHDSADKLDHDLRRQNALLNLGIELRRFSARRIRREPEEVMAEIKQFLSKKPVL